MYLIRLRRHEEARVHAEEALELSRELRLAVLVAPSLLYLALVAIARQDVVEPGLSAGVTRLFGFVDAQFVKLGVPKAFCMPQEHDRALTVLRDAIGADELAKLMAVGAMMTEDEAIAQAHALA
jgi:hypothetical protein